MTLNPAGEIEVTTASVRLSRDLAKASTTLGIGEARILADMFETTQQQRIRRGNQVKALEKSEEPNSVLRHFFGIEEALEAQIGRALKKYTESTYLGSWMMSQKGVGPLLAARFLAFVDWDAAHNPSQVWAFAGLDPNRVWEKGQKRPWNARLKRLCFLLGESFVKVQHRDGAFYGQLFTRQKGELWLRNLNGANRDRALILREKVGKTTEAYRWNNGDVPAEAARMVASGTWPAGKKPWGETPGAYTPMLAPAHVHAMARRWVVKLFLAHVWEINMRSRPVEEQIPGWTPYAIGHLTGHSHIIKPPGFGPGGGEDLDDEFPDTSHE